MKTINETFCFNFFPGEYLKDISLMDDAKAEKVYNKILCEHSRLQVITDEMFELLTIRLTPTEKQLLLLTLKRAEPSEEFPAGGYCIPWVVREVNNRLAFCQSRSQNRKGDGEKKTSVPHLEYEKEKGKRSTTGKKTKKASAQKVGGAPGADLDTEQLSASGFRPGPEDIDQVKLSDVQLGSIEQLLSINGYKEITSEEIEGLYEVFKAQNFTSKKYYEHKEAIFSHFLNWTNGKYPNIKIPNNATSAATPGSHKPTGSKGKSGFTAKNGGFDIVVENLRNDVEALQYADVSGSAYAGVEV